MIHIFGLAPPVELTNSIIGGLVSIILLWMKLDNDRQTRNVAKILKITNEGNTVQSNEIKEAIDISNKSIKRDNRIIKISSDKVEINARRLIVNTSTKLVKTLDENRKLAAKLAQLTEKDEDIKMAEQASEEYYNVKRNLND